MISEAISVLLWNHFNSQTVFLWTLTEHPTQYYTGSMSEGITPLVEESGSSSSCSLATAQDNSRHIHFHMHLGHTITPLSSADLLQHHPTRNILSVSAAEVDQRAVVTKQAPHFMHGHQQAAAHPLLPLGCSPVVPRQEQSEQQQQQQQQQTEALAEATLRMNSNAVSAKQQSSGPNRRTRQRLKAVARAVLLSGAATAAVLAGAGAAVVILSPRVEQLEVRCLEMQQQNKQLAQHTTSLAAAKQHLEQQLSNLQAAKAELDKQVAALTAQQGGLLQHNQQLADKLAALHGSQQQLQLVADRLHAQVEDANSKLEQQQQKDNKGTKETGGDGGDKLASAAVSGSTVLPVASSGVAPRPGDLSVQVTIPGFTDALVSRVGEADLVPQFATALVAQVKESQLVGNAVDVLLGKIGQQVSGVLCPWKWGISLPWQTKAAAASSSSSEQQQ